MENSSIRNGLSLTLQKAIYVFSLDVSSSCYSQ